MTYMSMSNFNCTISHQVVFFFLTLWHNLELFHSVWFLSWNAPLWSRLELMLLGQIKLKICNLCLYSGLGLMVWTTQAVLTCTLSCFYMLWTLVTFTGIVSVIRGFHSLIHSQLYLHILHRRQACSVMSKMRCLWKCQQTYLNVWAEFCVIMNKANFNSSFYSLVFQ